MRLRPVVAMSLLLLVFGLAGTAVAGEAPPSDGPAVTIGDPAEPPAEEAWTFRFLVPTLLAMAAVGLAMTAFAYARRVKGRYRLSR